MLFVLFPFKLLLPSALATPTPDQDKSTLQVVLSKVERVYVSSWSSRRTAARIADDQGRASRLALKPSERS